VLLLILSIGQKRKSEEQWGQMAFKQLQVHQIPAYRNPFIFFEQPSPLHLTNLEDPQPDMLASESYSNTTSMFSSDFIANLTAYPSGTQEARNG
jgi:hypothetical protein